MRTGPLLVRPASHPSCPEVLASNYRWEREAEETTIVLKAPPTQSSSDRWCTSTNSTSHPILLLLYRPGLVAVAFGRSTSRERRYRTACSRSSPREEEKGGGGRARDSRLGQTTNPSSFVGPLFLVGMRMRTAIGHLPVGGYFGL